ncbi:MAG: methionine synthase [Firmicutes bacterium]|nr:methionine synthase [Bacillota bacterium]
MSGQAGGAMDGQASGRTDGFSGGQTRSPAGGPASSPAPRGLILGAAVGDCVHVAGIQNFLRLAESHGYRTLFLGPAVGVESLAGAVRTHRPALAAVGYRLTPEALVPLLAELEQALARERAEGLRLVFGGTAPVARVAAASGLFKRVFSPEDGPAEAEAFLSRGLGSAEAQAGSGAGSGMSAGETGAGVEAVTVTATVIPAAAGTGTGAAAEPGAGTDGPAGDPFPGDLVGRIRFRAPHPLLRHHFGLRTVAGTVRGIEEIAGAGVLDVVSLGPDQNAQECFFRPEEMDPGQDGAGGVPIRSPEDLSALHQAARRGNHPLMRCYSGTRDVLRFAKVLRETIANAWCAVPLCWYNTLDGRGPRGFQESFNEARALIRWHAEGGIPVEVNESHQWSLRWAHDALAVAMAFLAAYNAKTLGVRHYVAQYMFNNPPGLSMPMDLAKMLAKIDLIESLHDGGFTTFREVRAGLASFPAEPGRAKGHLAASTFLAAAVRPHIVHVVGYCEADHAATAPEIIESCRIVEGVLAGCLQGMPDPALDPAVQRRREQLVGEAGLLLEALRRLAPPDHPDPWCDAAVIEEAVRRGILDTPHFQGHAYARGRVVTAIRDGACVAVEPGSGRVLGEAERLRSIGADLEA